MKKILALFISIIMIVGLVGCGKKAMTEDEYMETMNGVIEEWGTSDEAFMLKLVDMIKSDQYDSYTLVEFIQENDETMSTFIQINPPENKQLRYNRFKECFEDSIKYKKEIVKEIENGNDPSIEEFMSNSKQIGFLFEAHESELKQKRDELKQQVVNEVINE